MHDSILLGLQAMRSDLRERWEALLREAPVTSPLASPDVLVHLMNWTLDEVFKSLTCPPNRRRAKHRHADGTVDKTRLHCRCGMNPLQTYFICLEQALSETAYKVFRLMENPWAADREVILAETRLAVSTVATREMNTFCAVCQHGAMQVSKTELASGSAMQALPVR